MSSLPCLGGRWQLGMSSNTDAQGIMNEVYRVLRKFNFEWKVLSLYKLKARYPAGLVDRTGKPVSGSEVCKIGLQLYRTQGRADHSGGMTGSSSSSTTASSTPTTMSPYIGPTNPPATSTPNGGGSTPTGPSTIDQPSGAHVIDIQKLAGLQFLFLELSSHLIASLMPTYGAPSPTHNANANNTSMNMQQ